MFNNVGGGVRTQPPSNNPPPLMSIMTLHPDIQQQSNNPNPGLRGVAPPANNGGGNIRLPDFTQPPPTMLRPMPPPPQPQQQSPLQIQQKPHQASNIPPPHHIIVQQRPQQPPPPRPTVVTQILKRSPQVRLLVKSNFSTSFLVSLSPEVLEGSFSEDEVEVDWSTPRRLPRRLRRTLPPNLRGVICAKLLRSCGGSGRVSRGLLSSAYRKPAFQPSAFRRLFIGFQPSAENQPIFMEKSLSMQQ